MHQFSRPVPPKRRIIIIALALLILAGSFLLVHSSLIPRGASAAVNEPLPGCRKSQGCMTPTATAMPMPTSTPGAISITPTSQPAPCPPGGPQCTGEDPVEQGCFDMSGPGGYGIASMNIVYNQQGHKSVIGRIDERYAQNCHSWWIRAFVYQGEGYVYNIMISTKDGSQTMYTKQGSEVYTDMIYAPANDLPSQHTAIVYVYVKLANTTMGQTLPLKDPPCFSNDHGC